MATRHYNEYIKVDPNFIPVFSRNSDRTYPDKWQSFYPHDSFKNILKHIVETLEKSSDLKDRSVWMSGAYGTGKTFASFVVKHILEDSIDSITPYFTQNSMDTLLARVKGIRSKGRILVVQRSASAGINTPDKLLNAVVESVRKAVKDAGLSYLGAESLSEKVLSILKHPEASAFNFQGAFLKHRGKFTDYSSTDGIIRDLEELDLDDKLELLDTIIEVAALEGFNWSMSTDEVVDWLEDVRRGNDLYAIVFIWDEFTEYFKNNQNNIGGLQEIAMASSRINCYLFLITHSSAGQLIHDKGAKAIIEARFKLDTIELEESTAFKLLGQALRHEPALDREWNYTCEQLWDGVKRGCVDVIKSKDLHIQDSDFKSLLPMHPYAAYLLKFIAKDISSNQRTIFQFLSGDYAGDDSKTNFKWFIDHYAFDYGKWNYLTADYLWDYFFETSNIDLDSVFLQTVSHYNNYALACDDPADKAVGERRRRVLKVALLLFALQTKNSANARTGATSLMRPTFANIKACFVGTPEESYVDQDLAYFESKGMLGKLENSWEILYVMNSTAIDTERMNKTIEETRKAVTFERLVADPTYDVAKQFRPDGFLAKRMKVSVVTTVNAGKEAEQFRMEDNRTPTFFLFAKNEAEQGKIREAVSAIFSKAGKRCVVVDFSSSPFSDMLFAKLVESKAKEKYFSTIPNQKSQCELAKKASQEIINEWTRRLAASSCCVYTVPDSYVQRNGVSNLRKEFKAINSELYGCGLEEISQNEKLFSETGFKATAAQMAMGKSVIPSNYSYVRNISSRLEADGIWNTPKYWEIHPTHPVSRMKAVINEIVEQGFEKSDMVSMTDIWDALRRPPFGLLPNTGSVFLMGFLLGDYADSSYYKRDTNNNTVSLNYVDLSELIFGVVKELPKAQGQFIVKQTPEQTSFCQKTGEIFRIAMDKRNSVDDIAKNINIFLTNNKYPMWAMRYYIEEELDENVYQEELAKLADLFCEFIKPDTTVDRERSKIVADINRLYARYNAVDEVFKELLTAANMRSGMNYYIARYKPELVQIAGGLKIEPKEYLELLNSKLSSDSSYLWEIGDTNRQIDNLYVDLKLIYDINRVLTIKQRTYADARNALVEKLNIVKIPIALLKELRPELSTVIDVFILIKENRMINKAEVSSTIANYSESFASFFDNQFEPFCEAVNRVLNTPVSADEYEYLFNKVPSGTLFAETDKFKTALQRELTNLRKSKKINKMFDTWINATGISSPAEWSQQNGIPILCLFSDDILIAQKVFDALNRTTSLPLEKDVDSAIEFLQGGKLNILKDAEKCTRRFVEYFAEGYAYIITSPDELRDQIRAVAGSKVYNWYAKAQSCKSAIQRFAVDRYKVKYRTQVKDRVKRLTAEQAQSYLNELIENDPLLGISILKGDK